MSVAGDVGCINCGKEFIATTRIYLASANTQIPQKVLVAIGVN